MQAPNYFGRDLEAMSFARNYHNWILAEFAPYLSGDVLEIGAGTGNFSALLLSLQKINRLLAVEPSANMFPLLQENLGGAIRATIANSTLDAIHERHRDQFDAVTYINVLEHVEDDARQLAYARSVLKTNGCLLIFVPALPRLYSEFDRQLGHFRRYTGRGLREVVSASGFVIERQKYMDIAGIVPWYIAFVLLKLSMTAGKVSLYDKLVVPLMRRVEPLIGPPIGKSLVLVARKG